MIKILLFVTLTFTSLLFGDFLEDLRTHLPKIIDQTPEVEGEFLHVEPLPNQGGSFINSVYLVTTTAKEQLVLKIENSNWQSKKTLNEVASIKFLKAHTTIPVPHILAFENKIEHSPFGTEYILMDKLKGTPLNHEIEKIYANKADYTLLLSNLASILAKLHSIQFQSMGNFKGLDSLKIDGIVDFPSYTFDTPLTSFSHYAYHTLNYYIQEMKHLSSKGHPNKKIFDQHLPILTQILDTTDFSYLDHPEDLFIYAHQDFVMKNILVDGVTVTGVLDWEWSGSTLPEFEAKTGLDFLFTDEDRALFATLLEKNGIPQFFSPPPSEREHFYQFIGTIYALISCYEWIEGNLEHSAKFLDQKLEQRVVRNNKTFNMDLYINEKLKELDKHIKKFELRKG